MMRRLFLFLLIVALLGSCCAACTRSSLVSPEEEDILPAEQPDAALPESGHKEDVRNYIACSYSDETIVRAHIAAAEPPTSIQDITGAIVPHYAPAMYMVADLLAARKDAPDTVVIVAPNHTGEGAAIQISGCGYYWNAGSLAGDETLAAELAKALEQEPDSSAAQRDWSASLLIPYIGHYFPQTHVVTILLSRGAGAAHIQTLAETLATIAATQELLLLGSVDFSHYQDEPTARRCDQETLRIMEDGDISKLLTLGNDHLDSPETTALLLAYASQTERDMQKTDELLETFLQDGTLMAGSYYAFALT